MSPASTTTAGVVLLTVFTIAIGGGALLAHLRHRTPGYLDNPVRRGLWKAGHAHAGVLVIFALVALRYVDQADLSEPVKALVRTLMVAAPILMPLGFFLSVVRPRDTAPNKLIWLAVAGGACLAVGTFTLGLGLI